MLTSKLKKAFSSLVESRFATFFSILGIYISLSFLSRVVLMVWASKIIDYAMLNIFRAFITGLCFDLATGLAFLFLYALYLLLFPKRWIGSIFDKAFTFLYLFLILFIIFFSLMAEFPFWDEFGVRFNFIAVDYLIYTYEVISNIHQSYPLPLIFTVLFILIIATFFLLYKTKIFKHTFSSTCSFGQRAMYASGIFISGFLLLYTLNNKQADFSKNLTINEISKNGVFSFFAAFRSNELDYDTFYPRLDEKEAYGILKKQLLQKNQQFISGNWDDISRKTVGGTEFQPNIILVAIESFSADFLSSFGNTENLTPFYDSLSNHSIFFTNLYATGTRTVRGMEALTLCVPPTPGNSIVRRPKNDHLFSIASVLKERNYHPYFVYGGDGYFDNMNNFFGGQGFDIVDRNRGNPLSDNIYTRRYSIPDSEVSFENAWGICDEDLYGQAIKYADKSSMEKRPFFQFVMTTSNHKPYTFPNGKITMPQGKRNSAVRYTDYALEKFISEAKEKPWFKNTIFVVVADHCASSAGKWEITISKHHIPAIIYNLPQPPQKIDRLTSQIDLLPTLFGYLNWNYHSSFYGKDINQVNPGEERAFIGNYRTLGMLKDKIFTELDDTRKIKQFNVFENTDSLSEIINQNIPLVSETISNYQTASERFKNGKMKE